MKKILFSAFMMLIALTFAACSDDKDEEKQNDEQTQKELLIGKWVLTKDVYTENGETSTDEFTLEEEVDVIIYNNDGTCRNYYKMENGEYDYDINEKWILEENNQLTTPYYGIQSQKVTILKLDKTTLMFEFVEGNIEETVTYTKVQ